MPRPCRHNSVGPQRGAETLLRRDRRVVGGDGEEVDAEGGAGVGERRDEDGPPRVERVDVLLAADGHGRARWARWWR